MRITTEQFEINVEHRSHPSHTLAMSAMATVTASSRLPVLPPEIWAIVFRNYSTDLKGLPRLWTQCRHVSKQFRAEVETAFVTYYLPMVSLSFMSLKPYYVLQTHFVKLLRDSKIALFRAHVDEQTRADLRTNVKEIRCCRLELGEFGWCIREWYFPTMREDEAAFEMDWKELFNQFF